MLAANFGLAAQLQRWTRLLVTPAAHNTQSLLYFAQLLESVRQGKADLTAHLLQFGCDVSGECSPLGDSLLHMAVELDNGSLFINFLPGFT